MMRLGTRDARVVVFSPGGEVAGIDLGWDHTADHEWGIMPLRMALRVGTGEVPETSLSHLAAMSDAARDAADLREPVPLGLDSCLVGHLDRPVGAWAEGDGDALLVVGSCEWIFQEAGAALERGEEVFSVGAGAMRRLEGPVEGIGNPLVVLPRIPGSTAKLERDVRLAFPAVSEFPHPDGRARLRRPKTAAERRAHRAATAGLRTAWDGSSFAVIARGDEAVAALGVVRDALARGRLTVGLGGNGGNPFARGGLVALDRDRVPAAVFARTAVADVEHRTLHEQARRSGVEKALKAAGKHAFDECAPSNLGPVAAASRP